ncbi:unnamed protein product [Cuscuta epithymum]|uniref:Uncharacterized protein n=1 Tax=Cuscuta epithymum TaxID=186058 RepID=A0AAV0C2C0_9ASTE|nr:unnamed protein product [Cuscuta epithymum]
MAAMKMTASDRFATNAGREELHRFRPDQMTTDSGGSIRVVLRIQLPPEPPSWVVRGDRVRECFPISYYYFVIWLLVIIYVVKFVSLFGSSAFLCH